MRLLEHMRFIYAIVISTVALVSSAQPTNQAWLNASRLATGYVPAYVLGTNDPVALNYWILVRTNNKAIWLDPAQVLADVGVVSSVGLGGSSLFTYSGTPVTGIGTLTLGLPNTTGFAKDTAGTGSWTLDLSAATALNATSLTSGTVPNARLSAIPNSALANASLTVAGTANQVLVSGGGPVALGGTTTLSLPQDIGTASSVKFGALQVVGDSALNSILLTNEQRILETAWANGPTGAYDASIPLQTYTITANSAASSVSNQRTTLYENYSSFNVTNSSGSDVTFTWSASGVATSDGLRTYTMTNHQATTFKISTSRMGIWVTRIPHW